MYERNAENVFANLSGHQAGVYDYNLQCVGVFQKALSNKKDSSGGLLIILYHEIENNAI